MPIWPIPHPSGRFPSYLDAYQAARRLGAAYGGYITIVWPSGEQRLYTKVPASVVSDKLAGLRAMGMGWHKIAEKCGVRVAVVRGWRKKTFLLDVIPITVAVLTLLELNNEEAT
jgi:hypothetical protein